MYGLKNVHNRRRDALAQIDHKQFEVLMAEHYAGRGWAVEHVGTGSGGRMFDGGVDLKLRREGEYVLVQCKHWNAKQVTHNAVHELLGIKVNEGATGAIVITSGEFTTAAKAAAARQGHVELIDGDALRAMLGPLLSSVSEPASLTAPEGARNWSDHRPGSAMKRRGRSSGPGFAPLIKIVVAVFAVLILSQCVPKYVQGLVAPSLTVAPAPAAQEVATGRSAAPAPAPAPAYKPLHPPAVSSEQEAEALREWRRRNAESMKILEETTPEL